MQDLFYKKSNFYLFSLKLFSLYLFSFKKNSGNRKKKIPAIRSVFNFMLLFPSVFFP